MNLKLSSKKAKRALRKCHNIINSTYANVYEENKVSRNLKKYMSHALDQQFSSICN